MELQKRISDRMEGLLNIRLQAEYQSMHIYNGMANWCDCYGFYKAKDVYRKYADEELKHARILTDYIIDRNGKAKLDTINPATVEFLSLLDTFCKGYEHEKTITNGYNNLACIALEEKDHCTFEKLQWFIGEQIEEENKFGDIIISAERLGLTNESKGIEWFQLEDMFSK